MHNLTQIPLSSPRVLKANAARGLGGGISFNFEDLKQRCEEHLQRVREQSERILRDAQAEAEQIRRRAFEEAKAAGRRAGLGEADAEIEKRARSYAQQQVDERLKTVLPSFQAAAAALVHEHQRWLAAWQETAVGMCAGIAERIIRQRIATRPEIVADLIAEAWQLAAAQPHVRLHLNPLDVEWLTDHSSEIVKKVTAASNAELVSDPSITRGGCLIESDHGTVDARLETMLERIACELIDED